MLYRLEANTFQISDAGLLAVRLACGSRVLSVLLLVGSSPGGRKTRQQKKLLPLWHRLTLIRSGAKASRPRSERDICRAARWRRRIVLLAGEAGVGKTRLLDACLSRAGLLVIKGETNRAGDPALWPDHRRAARLSPHPARWPGRLRPAGSLPGPDLAPSLGRRQPQPIAARWSRPSAARLWPSPATGRRCWFSTISSGPIMRRLSLCRRWRARSRTSGC